MNNIVSQKETTPKKSSGRHSIEVVEQESELTKVKYNIIADNRTAVFSEGIGIIDDYMASDDLNECVDAILLKKSKAAFKQHADALANAKTTSNTPSSRGNKVPRVVIRHRVKGSKKNSKRLRKNTS
jgi:hypothetical protein